VLGVLLTKELILTGLLQREETDRGPTVPVETQLIVMAVQLILRATAVLMEQGRVLALRAIAVVAVMVVVKLLPITVVLEAEALVLLAVMVVLQLVALVELVQHLLLLVHL